MEKKVCSTCKTSKPKTEFYKRAGSYDGLRSQCKSCKYKARIAYRKTPRGKFLETKADAKRRDLKFTLKFEEFLSFEDVPCHYCGYIPDTISLDRVDNDLGYHIDNVVSCCYMCNSMKHIFNKEDFLAQVKNIYLYQQKVKHDE